MSSLPPVGRPANVVVKDLRAAPQSSYNPVIKDFKDADGNIIDSVYDWLPAGQPLPTDCRPAYKSESDIYSDAKSWDNWDSSSDFDIDTWEAQNENTLSEPSVSRCKPKYEPGSELDYISLPGMGEKTSEKCGKVLKAAMCSCGEKRTFGYNCHNYSCPVCYEGTAVRAAEHAKERIFEGAKVLFDRGLLKSKAKRHITYSPPQNWAIALLKTGIRGYNKLIKISNGVITSSGFSGAVMFHPWRQNDPKKDNYNPEMDDFVYYLSPHFHVFGCGFIEKSDTFYKDTGGWTYKNIGLRDANGVKNGISYTLTHFGHIENKHAVRYIGLFSYNKLVIDKVERFDEVLKCPSCGCDMIAVFVDLSGTPRWDTLEGPLWICKKVQTFKLSASFELMLSKNKVITT